MSNNQSNNPGPVIFSLSFTMMVGMWGPAVLYSILPLFQENLNISSVQAGMLISLYIIAASLSMLLGGVLGDKYGRKKIIVIGITIYGLCGFLGFIITEFTTFPILLYIVRIIQGFTNGLFMPNILALAGDLFDGDLRTKAMGMIESFISFGGVIAPFIATIVAAASWNAPFLLYPLISIISILCIYFFIPVNNYHKEEHSKTKISLKVVLKRIRDSKNMQRILLLGFITYFVFLGIQSFIAIYLKQRFVISLIEIGLVTPLPALGMSLSSLYISKYGLVLNPLKQVYLGLLTIIVSLFFMPFTAKWFFYCLLFILGISCGLIIPTLSKLLANLTKKYERGVFYSVYFFLRTLGSAIGPIFFTSLLGLSKMIPFLAGSILTFVFYIISKNILLEKGQEE